MSLFSDDIKVTNDIKRYVRKTYEITDYISFLLAKNNMSQRDLAKALDKKESEISKWLSGDHNLTIKTICKIEALLNENIITTNSIFSHRYHFDNEIEDNNLKVSLNEIHPGTESQIEQIDEVAA
jgi:transcriptional regulator with XRE-family HTH domain